MPNMKALNKWKQQVVILLSEADCLSLFLCQTTLFVAKEMTNSPVCRSSIIAPAGPIYSKNKNGGNCQSGTLNHQNGQNVELITYCTGDCLAKFGFVQACIDT
jgi:hypothetical protein